MPRLSCWFIRTALLYLLAGFTLGGLLLVQKAWPFAPELWRLLPIHAEFLLIGWSAQLALGTAFWILPRWNRGALRGDERPAWLAYGLLNTGLLVAALGLWQGWADLATAGHATLCAAGLAFAWHAWPRVKPLNG